MTIKRTFQLNGTELIFNLKQSEFNSNQVESQKFRNSTTRVTPVVFSDTSDVLDEIETVISLCEGKEIDTQTFFDALYEICKFHISQYGRLIDNDMDSYIDRVLMVMEAVSHSEGKFMSEESGLKLRNLFTENTLKSLLSHIYVTRRDSIGKAYLVKLSDELQNR